MKILETREKFLELFFLVFVDERFKTTPTENLHTRLYVDLEDAQNVVPFPYQKDAIEYYLNKFKN